MPLITIGSVVHSVIEDGACYVHSLAQVFPEDYPGAQSL